MNYLNNVKELIEKDIIFVKTNKLHEENHKLNTYFNIGRLIVEAQGGEKRAKYGNNLIKIWSLELTKLYGKGYDISNLKRMRKFYLVFQKGGSLPHLFINSLTWTNLTLVLSIKEQSKRNYYVNLCIRQNLSSRKLKEKIKNKEYERLEYKNDIDLIDSNNNEMTLTDMIKDPIIIRTDKNIDKLSEKALKKFILDKIEDFLLELGVGFTYVGSEVNLGGYKCDLLFFNVELLSYIIIELKTRKLKHTDIGQIKFYMNYVDMNIKKDYMNKTIGLIMCKEDNEIVLKYTTDERIFKSTYKLI